MKQEIYLVVCYGLDGEMEIFKAYEDKYLAKVVAKDKQKTNGQNNFWKVLPTHLVLKDITK